MRTAWSRRLYACGGDGPTRWDTLRYGPLKPVGLKDPQNRQGALRRGAAAGDNAAGTIYNIVGFQTHLKFPEQKRVFSMIPALRNAEFVRYGVMHRNTSPLAQPAGRL